MLSHAQRKKSNQTGADDNKNNIVYLNLSSLVNINFQMSGQLISKLKEQLGARSIERTDQVNCYLVDGHKRLFVKSSISHDRVSMMDGEIESLRQILTTGCIRAPKPELVLHNYDESGASTIVMEYLDLSPLSDISASSLAKDLFELHSYNERVLRFQERAKRWIGGIPPAVKAVTKASICDEENQDDSEEDNQFSKHDMRVAGLPQNAGSKHNDNEFADRFIPHKDPSTGKLFEGIEEFGFQVPTACGSIAQVNHWTDDWPSFFARYRLDHPIRALLSDHGDRELSQQWAQLQLKLSKFFVDYETRNGDKIIPALLHGDLWSGNVAQLTEDGGKGVIYDPSSFYGHSEYDFAIARMFGGFPKSFEQAYFEAKPKKKLFDLRNKLYQLFHHLNHWLHFGSGYRASSLRILKDLNNLV